jgi:hypothetical protein
MVDSLLLAMIQSDPAGRRLLMIHASARFGAHESSGGNLQFSPPQKADRLGNPVCALC